MPTLAEVFKIIDSYSMTQLSVKPNDSVTICEKSLRRVYTVLAQGHISELQCLHPQLPISLKLAQARATAETREKRTYLYSDEASIIYDNLIYGTITLRDIKGKRVTGSRILSIEHIKRKVGEAQSFELLIRTGYFETKKIDGSRVPIFTGLGNEHFSIPALEIDKVFPGWTTRYIEAKALGAVDDLMAYVFNPSVAQSYDKGVAQVPIIKEPSSIVLPNNIYTGP